MKMRLMLLMVGMTVLVSCNRKTEYQKVKEREMASGVIYNDIFLDLEFGMPRKKFFDACWEMNQQGLLTDGANALKVNYKPQLPSGEMCNMYFYPKFEDDKIYYMPVEFQYRDWSPTNPKYSSENLVEDVVAYINGWYGEGFFRVEDSNGNYAMARIDGNRMVRVYEKSLSAVRVDILDLRVKDITEIQ